MWLAPFSFFYKCRSREKRARATDRWPFGACERATLPFPSERTEEGDRHSGPPPPQGQLWPAQGPLKLSSMRNSETIIDEERTRNSGLLLCRMCSQGNCRPGSCEPLPEQASQLCWPLTMPLQKEVESVTGPSPQHPPTPPNQPCAHGPSGEEEE